MANNEKQDKLIKLEDAPIEAEIVDAKLVKKKKQRKRMSLERTKYYHKLFKEMPAKELMEMILRQQDAALLLNKENLLAAMEAVAEGDTNAITEVESLTRSSMMLAKEKADTYRLFAELGLSEVSKPVVYKAPLMTNDEWEKTFKPGSVEKIKPEQPEVFTGPAPKTVN